MIITRKKIMAVLGTLALTMTALLTTDGGSAHANTQRELYLNHAPGWCATYNDTEYGAVVLGMCANAATQQFNLHTVSGNIFEIVADDGVGNLCVTYNYPNGHPDGGTMILGVCANAQTQEFYGQVNSLGDVNYWMPYRVDNNGSSVTLDDANYVLEPFNPINGSWKCLSCGQEQWSQLYT